MTDPGRVALEKRLLVLAPIGKDAALTAGKLGSIGVECHVCKNVSALALELDKGAAGALIAEEALADGAEPLAALLARQPPWSDLPILVMTRTGADSTSVELALRTLGNVILLERPIRVSTLVSAARTALRARARQYESRAQLLLLEEADRRKDEFLATLAHELRNPLAPIRNSVELLRLAGGNLPMGQRLAEVMGRQVSHMVRLVDDLMEISRITRGKIELRRSRVELATIIATAVETSRPLIEAGRHDLDVVLPPEETWLDADATRLAQVFSNLLNNASKYTDEGGRITLVVERAGDEVEVRVRDSGIGIPAALLPRVFDMFTQGTSATARASGGLGIGLTLVRGLVEMHGGSVTAQSDGPGKGSVFTVRLPQSVAGAQAYAPRGDDPSVRMGAPPRILVVDDNQDSADSLGALLEMLGATVAVAHDGEAALEALDIQRPHIVFLDIGMPRMDGYEVARRIRERPGGHDTYLVALTGWGQQKDRLESEAAGFDRHMVKPADIGTLESLLQAAALTASR